MSDDLDEDERAAATQYERESMRFLVSASPANRFHFQVFNDERVLLTIGSIAVVVQKSGDRTVGSPVHLSHVAGGYMVNKEFMLNLAAQITKTLGDGKNAGQG